MEKQTPSRAPLFIAVVLLILPLLYLGSYLLLVWPDGERFNFADSSSDFPTYRYGSESWAAVLYWPLEKIDRKLRPDSWQPAEPLRTPHKSTIGDDGLERIGIDFGP